MISINDILFRHLIKFDYDVSNAFSYKAPHYLFKVEDSIHYKTLVEGDFTNYNTLIKTTNQTEHSEEMFKTLINEFNEEEFNVKKMRMFYDDSLSKYVVKDGCHRLAILKYNNKNEIPVDWFNIEK